MSFPRAPSMHDHPSLPILCTHPGRMRGAFIPLSEGGRVEAGGLFFRLTQNEAFM